MATPQETTDSVTTICSKFVRLDKRLRQSYTNYKKLSIDGEIAGFYKYSCSTDPLYICHPRYDDEMKPGEHTSDYLRGGVISTIATFEAFVGGLINKATKLVAKQYKHETKCQQGDHCDLREINPDMCKRFSNRPANRLSPKDVRLHNWDTSNLIMCTCTCAECTKTHRKVYARYLLTKSEIENKKSLVDVILEQGEFRFSYLISGVGESQITIAQSGQQSKCFICIMLRFCYGVRCVMAHGNSKQTYKVDGALFDFCKRCKLCGCADTCATCECFEDTARLVELFDKYNKKLPDTEKDDADRIVRRNPTIEEFETFQTQHNNFLSVEEWKECFRIIDKHFKDPDEDPLPASYAYFHMIRVYYWLKKSKRDMYITYGMFQRITQFIHTLSFRMYLAVAQLLIDNYGLQDGVWGVEKIKIETMITDFEAELENTRAVP